MPKHNRIDEMDTSEPVYTQDDFVFCKKENGEITSCGFRIDSTLMKHNMSPFIVYSTKQDNHMDTRDNVSDMFRNKSVPMGIYHTSAKRTRYPVNIEDDAEELEIDDDLYEKLLGLVEVSQTSRKKMTKKKKQIKQHKKTKKNEKSS